MENPEIYVQFAQSQKKTSEGKKDFIVIFDGYIFHKEQSQKKSGVYVFRCAQRRLTKCKARIRIEEDGKLISEKPIHTHSPKPGVTDRRRFSQNSTPTTPKKDQIATDPTTSPMLSSNLNPLLNHEEVSTPVQIRKSNRLEHQKRLPKKPQIPGLLSPVAPQRKTQGKIHKKVIKPVFDKHLLPKLLPGLPKENKSDKIEADETIVDELYLNSGNTSTTSSNSGSSTNFIYETPLETIDKMITNMNTTINEMKTSVDGLTTLRNVISLSLQPNNHAQTFTSALRDIIDSAISRGIFKVPKTEVEEFDGSQ